MDSSEISLVKFNAFNYFSVIINARPFQPISTLLIKLVEALISSEDKPDENVKKRVEWIYNNTHKDINKHISIVELAVFKNLDRGLNREVDIGNDSFFLIELYRILDEVAKELTQIVIRIAKKYSIDLPVMNFGGKSSEGQNVSI